MHKNIKIYLYKSKLSHSDKCQIIFFGEWHNHFFKKYKNVLDTQNTAYAKNNNYSGYKHEYCIFFYLQVIKWILLPRAGQTNPFLIL